MLKNENRQNSVVFFVDENNKLCVNCEGIVADLETNLSIDDIIEMRNKGVDPLILFEKILQEIQNLYNDETITEQYDTILTKMMEFFVKIFETEKHQNELEQSN